jgi:hypothetical protein
MQLEFGLSTFHVLIVHLNKHEKHVRSAILLNVCPIRFEWFITNDIIIVFLWPHIPPFCLFAHLQTSITCVVEFIPKAYPFTYISGKAWALVLCMKNKSKL